MLISPGWATVLLPYTAHMTALILSDFFNAKKVPIEQYLKTADKWHAETPKNRVQ